MNLERLTSIRYWIFDMDGTLTIPEHDFAYMRKVIGLPSGEKDILKFLAGLPKEQADEKREWMYQYGEKIAKSAKAAPSALSLLKALSNHGKKLALLTRNHRDLALITLKSIGMEDLFDPNLILGRNEAEAKPSPDGINQILQYWQASPSDSIMVGDYTFDLDAGRNAGTYTMLVNRDENLWPDRADYYFKDLSQLYKCLKSLYPQ